MWLWKTAKWCKYDRSQSFVLNFESDAKGLCYGEKIGIKKDMTSNEKACILAEEIGHFKKTVGNILDQSIIGNKNKKKLLVHGQ